MVKINGAELDVAGRTVAEYLNEVGYNLNRIVVERNGDIIPKSAYGTAVLEDGDSLEIVGFVGGG